MHLWIIQRHEHACVLQPHILAHSDAVSTGAFRGLHHRLLFVHLIDGSWICLAPRLTLSRPFSSKSSSHLVIIFKGRGISSLNPPGFAWWMADQTGLQFDSVFLSILLDPALSYEDYIFIWKRAACICVSVYIYIVLSCFFSLSPLYFRVNKIVIF